MRSVLASAVLATALFGEAFARGSPHRHGHQHLHAKKADEHKRAVGSEVVATIDGKVVSWANEYSGEATSSAAAAATTTAAASSAAATTAVADNYIAASKSTASSASSAASSAAASSSSVTVSSDFLVNALTKNSVLTGTNEDYNDNAVGIGSGGAFEFAITNSASEDVVIVLWSANGETADWSAQEVQVNQPDITMAIGCGETQSISFKPSAYSGGSISGAFSVLSSKSSMVDGYIANTWGEFTVTEASIFSTFDVSKLLMTSGGNGISAQLYEKKDGTATCLSDMSTCVYDVVNGANTIVNCSGSDQDANGDNGGCMFVAETGYAEITITDS